MLRRTILVTIFAVLLLAGRMAAADQSALTVETAAGKQPFTVELATTSDQMALGLMFRQSMPADAGMLFIYPSEQHVEFWMKNTLIPLDMVFIDADGHVESIAANTTPMSEKIIRSKGMVVSVLELKGGRTEKLNIHAGAVIRVTN